MTPGSRVLVVGLGVSGEAAARELLRRGVEVRAVDAGRGPALEARAEALRAEGATVGVGRTAADDIDGVDLVVTSPGVPQNDAVLAAALHQGVPVHSEPELAWRLAAGRTRLLAVTGTNGKTTTSELLADCLGAVAAGNIGTPLVSVLGADNPPGLVVAELSSFQLRFTHTLRPDVAVLLNLSPDHLDWHGGLDGYRTAKSRVWRSQQPTDWAVVNADDAGAQAAAAAEPPPGRRAAFTRSAPRHGQVGIEGGAIVAFLGDEPVEVAAVADLAIRGPHNEANAAAAVAAACCAGADPRALAAALRGYQPGEHRLEVVATVGGVRFVNDSKATNPHAAAAALASFGGADHSDGRVVWIAGGLAKGLTFESLRPDVARCVRAAATIGTAGPELARLVRGLGLPVVEAGTLDVAVRVAADLAHPGDTVLLAPACASMDQFR
ncbi:MAG: UDP-N-acetylmuramoyl-L-alanine--D-glutamate ligase, partial [Actinomycetota bacterium]|nr:UDP-N-acetylmuramoyl-L-alanine--D-glutamate ligase [Actinomycetota bacterium]